VPVFVCRKAHKTTFWMAQQLGFVTIDMGIQYAGDIKEDELLEVRNELHFRDGSAPSKHRHGTQRRVVTLLRWLRSEVGAPGSAQTRRPILGVTNQGQGARLCATTIPAPSERGSGSCGAGGG
jgi:hypothetical protein